jgi:hypothetical protein
VKSEFADGGWRRFKKMCLAALSPHNHLLIAQNNTAIGDILPYPKHFRAKQAPHV